MRRVGSVSAADGVEEAPSETLFAWSVERFGDRPTVELFAWESHDAIAGDSVS
jgi:hypothetical protein